MRSTCSVGCAAPTACERCQQAATSHVGLLSGHRIEPEPSESWRDRWRPRLRVMAGTVPGLAATGYGIALLLQDPAEITGTVLTVVGPLMACVVPFSFCYRPRLSADEIDEARRAACGCHGGASAALSFA